jgi:Tfp pilus assembly protein FimT
MRSGGFSLYEALIVCVLVAIIAASSLPSLFAAYQHEESEQLKQQLIHALTLAKSRAEMTRETLAFCLAHKTTCFDSQINNAMIYADTFHDGLLHERQQIRAVINLPKFRGQLYFRSFPKYRRSVLFSPAAWVTSDNGTFWLCTKKAGKPSWAISINRLASIHVISPDADGQILDSKGKALVC